MLLDLIAMFFLLAIFLIALVGTHLVIKALGAIWRYYKRPNINVRGTKWLD